jgi:hypothetical protein
MKFFLASLLLFVGSCATVRHSERVKLLKDSIVFKDKTAVETYMNSITVDDLKRHVYEISDDKYEGRLTGDKGHNMLCEYLKSHYDSLSIASPKRYKNYYQNIPKSYLPDGLNASQNVVAYIEGSVFPDEYIIISAHSDHEGIIDGNIYNGADDNASGTAALLEISEAFKLASKNGHRPKRSIVFLHLTGEEKGLIGSRFYIENPIFSLEKTVTNLNTDMIGRVDDRHKTNENYIYLIGSDRLSTELDFIVQKANTEFTNLELDYKYNAPNDPNRYYNRSDQYNFALKGIPVIFFFNGEHEDYHKHTDTAEKINFAVLQKRVQLIFNTAWYIANAQNTLSREVL